LYKSFCEEKLTAAAAAASPAAAAAAAAAASSLACPYATKRSLHKSIAELMYQLHK
jgi:hypothetical protein